MTRLKAQKIWDNHPYPDYPCSTEHFGNQCAIRMGVALEKSGVDTSSFDKMYPNRRCYKGLNHNPKHILSAEEMAYWMKANTKLFGSQKTYTKATSANFIGKKGIVFIMNGWGSTDHIDIWIDNEMKGGSPYYFGLGERVWFWELD
ncbi:T6SS effector amidase Tae4 family protein [Microbulbifer sp. DLAB2-AA]|uniref:T6SS effector amidase Tae4 family protein n=1 Tax=unclassified Microbulbifer TaxID=2619833 RepID=UPI00403ADC5D